MARSHGEESAISSPSLLFLPGEETDTGFQLAKLCRSHSSDGHYDTFSNEHVLYSGLEERLRAEQAFDIAKGVDEGSDTKPRKLTSEQERSIANLRKIATGGYLGRYTPHGDKPKD